MREALEALRVAEGADIDIHGSRTLRKTKNRSIQLAQLQRNMQEKFRSEFRKLMENLTLSVSGSLIRRTSRELGRTILLYSLLSVRGLNISTNPSSLAAIFVPLHRTERTRRRKGRRQREGSTTSLVINEQSDVNPRQTHQ
uniref:Uncharacterized protein n=1 Tax=Opuntia streptacantha TaxID=393608 RepID=A0A7C8Z947_OPUST